MTETDTTKPVEDPGDTAHGDSVTAHGDNDTAHGDSDDSDDSGAGTVDDDGMSEVEYRQTVSQLIRMSPPPTFKHDVEETIRQRSGGRFFGRKAFGERIPYEIIAIIVLVIGVAVYLVLRSSTTGSLRYEKNHQEPPKMAPGARDVVPHPKKLDTGPKDMGRTHKPDTQ